MNRILKFFIYSVFLLSGLPLSGQNVYQGMVFAKQNRVEVSHDTLYFDMDVSIHGLKVNSRESLSLYPVLYHGTDSLELAPIILNGAHKLRKIKRAKALKEKYILAENAYAMLSDDPTIKQIVEYKDTLHFQPWMKEAGLKLTGKIKDLSGKTIQIYTNILTENLKLSD
ncbi:DUF3868 domain-containing protein [Parabacteroides sp. Marseille-P3160]|uniref:DUF3868 domain-containing protein n=1 Tax=Parabacteroides sp. Marseille-P3160 TaxID=1917887 RepID=UPI0009BB313B|nr:DUF3868 domain-containing protein [Parabacteroides sp. Marseille-P3160]